jgi:hypothetical protein
LRIIKLSNEVYGFDTVEACSAYFLHVLPWQKYRFNIVGEGYHLSSEKVSIGETLVFSYKGKIITVAKVRNVDTDDSKTVIAVNLQEDSLKILFKTVDLKELESVLKSEGYNKAITSAQGWNIITGNLEKKVIEIIMRNEWHDFLES